MGKSRKHSKIQQNTTETKLKPSCKKTVVFQTDMITVYRWTGKYIRANVRLNVQLG